MKIVENFWYPILDAHTLPHDAFKRGKPLRIKRFNKNLLLWNNAEGKLVCMEDKCAHKGVPLGLGRIIDGCIECPYHGMRYSDAGQCVHIPASRPDQTIPSNFGLQTNPVRVEHDFVWMWWGTERPTAEIPFYPEVAAHPAQPLACSKVYPASFYRLMESNFDGYHVDHLH